MCVARDERGPTLQVNTLRVTLDSLLPRPLYVVLADGTNFSARVTAPATPDAASAPGVACVANGTVVNVGCWGSSDGGPVADKAVWGTGKNVPKASSAEECCAVCANHSECAAWTWNGPKGNLYCYGCESHYLLWLRAAHFISFVDAGLCQELIHGARVVPQMRRV
jgi:hypothetical protein